MFSNHIKIALRSLLRNRAFASLNILGLGLGIACCLLIFMLVRHHLSYDQFHEKADRIALIVTEERGENADKSSVVPYPMAAALRQEYSFLEKTAMISARSSTLVTIEQAGQAPAKFKEEDERAFAEPELFEMFDFPLLQGDLNAFRQPNTALITEKVARKYYGTADAVGKTFKVNNYLTYQVVGVLRDLPHNTDISYSIFTSWATLTSDASRAGMLNNWGGINGGTQCYVLFREGHAASELEAAFSAFREKYFHPEVRDWYYHPVPLRGMHFDADYGAGVNYRQVWVLGLIGLFLLLTACINFINMATAQSLNRAREVGVRKTMGSTRGQLFWQFMSETSLIVLFSGIVGLILARLALPMLNRMTSTDLKFDFAQDLPLYGFMAGAMVLVAFLAGAYPGVALSGFRPAESLKGSLDTRKAGGFSLRRLLVGTQFAISQALIIAAVVVTSQMDYARKADLGFRKEGIITVPLPGDDDLSKKTTLKQRLSALAGVENVSLCMQPPASNSNWNTGLKLQGRAEAETWVVNYKFTDPDYLATFDLQLVAGRNLQPSDTLREHLVNEEVVKRLGMASNDEILGKLISVSGKPVPVVGVVRNFHNHSLHSKIQPQVFATRLSNYDVAAVRLNLQNAQPTLAAIEQAWTSIYPEYFYEQEFMDAQIAAFYERESILLQLARLFAGIAVFIGCLGLYGLAAFIITRKTKEIGIRKTLGASIAGILWMFGREYARLIVAAFVVAGPLAWWAMNHWLEDYEYRITLGAGIFAVSLLATFAIATLTVGVQSFRAALENPVKSLRSE